ncbi:hypothetical protein ACPOLB_01180 [Rubrivivax sp. RP6-9]|uniref:hypothetical protein n=1 Tax=Rubrivivax sp. RP6-9 TaxID=3415750 RepID=UPI003CC62B89
MAHQTPIRNPFMLMLQPEVVLAAIENSERLSQLNRHLCRPLDRPTLAGARADDDSADTDGDTDDALLEPGAGASPQ